MYVELYGEVTRGITVLKMRGSQHSKTIRAFEITDTGLHIGPPVQAMTGIMAGTPIVKADHHLRDMPNRARYLIETIERLGMCTLRQLQRETELPLERLEEEMGLLQQQGMVLSLERSDGVYYRTNHVR